MKNDKYIRSIAISLAASTTFGIATTVMSDTIVVDCMGSGDYETLQEAVDEAESGDTLNVLPCTYYVDGVDGNVSIDSKRLHIVSTEGPETTSIEVDKSYSLVVEGDSPHLTLEGFTIGQGPVGSSSAVKLLAGELTVNTCYFIDNGADASTGGAIFASDFDSLVVEDSYFENNHATRGGAIYAQYSNLDAVLHIDNTQFISNQALKQGGALYFDETPILVTSSLFQGNEATDDSGGAIYYNAGTLGDMAGIHQTEFKKNTAYNNGGALFIGNSTASMFIRDCRFQKNSLSGPGSYGGAVALSSATCDFESCLFFKNSSYHGGAIDVYLSEAHFWMVEFKKNAAAEGGGGLHIDESIASLEDVTLAKNDAGYSSGGGALCYWATVQLINVSFSKNKAFEGGGLYAEQSQVTFDGGLLEKNKATNIFEGNENTGGAMSIIETSIRFKSLEVLKNKTNGSVGGISLDTCDGKIVKCTIEDNEDYGLKFLDSPTVEMKKTTSCNNDAKDINGDFIDEGDNLFCNE